VRALTTSLKEKFGNRLYFPFELSSRRPIRPMQGYLFKLPRGFLDLFELSAGPEVRALQTCVQHEFSDNYRAADEFAAVTSRDPFAVDPALELAKNRSVAEGSDVDGH
jgi:hypothetical protein